MLPIEATKNYQKPFFPVCVSLSLCLSYFHIHCLYLVRKFRNFFFVYRRRTQDEEKKKYFPLFSSASFCFRIECSRFLINTIDSFNRHSSDQFHVSSSAQLTIFIEKYLCVQFGWISRWFCSIYFPFFLSLFIFVCARTEEHSLRQDQNAVKTIVFYTYSSIYLM